MLIWPHQRTIQVVDQAITIGAEYGHGSCRREQRIVERFAIGDLIETRGIADRAAGANATQAVNNANGSVAVDTNKARVRNPGQCANIAIAAIPLDGLPRRMHRPDVAGKTHTLALAHNLAGFAATEHGHAGWSEQAF